MNTTVNTVTVGALPWYRSPQQIGLVTTAVSAALALFPQASHWLGLTNPGDIANAVTAVFGVITLIAPIVGGVWRAKSPLQPLTLTQAGADVHPATIVALHTETIPPPFFPQSPEVPK